VITDVFALVGFLNVLYSFGMETAYFRFATKSGADEQKIFNLAQTAVVAISVVLSVALIAMAGPLSASYGFADPTYLYWLIAIMFIDAVVIIPFARLRLQRKALPFALGKFINIVIIVGLNIYFLWFAYDPAVGVAYVFLANLIANAFYVVFFLRTLLSWRLSYDRSLSPVMFSYAYPVMLTGLAGMTNEMFSRKMLQYWLPENFYEGRTASYALGVFGACYKFAVLMNLAVQAFRYAAEPFFFSNAVDKNSPSLFARVNHYFVIVCCILLLGVSINMDILKYFLKDPRYWEGLEIVPVLLLGYLFLGVYYNLSVWFKLTDKTYYGTIITVGGAVVTIAANYILIPIGGYMGSSWATLICYFGMTAACYFLGQRFYPIPYTVSKDLGYIIITTLLVYAVNSVSIADQWLASSFHAIVIVVYLMIIYFVERKHFKRTPS
jgi:O-antigen/teichoic acid export membrane protein